MSIGVCYYPEHWPRERWETDVREMAEAGLEYVRLAEFSWGRLEPERNAFDFEWLDEIVGLVGDHGMNVVLCTPTASPPRWLLEEHPEIVQTDRDGTVRDVGSRREYCVNSPIYREETERIVREMANRYADVPHVVGWQTDNEYGCHDTARCYCEDCATAFCDWLAEQYDDASALNDAWGTTFWSQQYDSIEQVSVPAPTPAQDHPSLVLDYRRFCSDSIVAYNRLQAEVLHEYGDWFVTHNFMDRFPAIDLHEMGDDLDLISWDSYPTGHVQATGAPATPDQLRAGDPDLTSFNHDLHRGVLGRPFWVMEQQPGDINWPPHSTQPAEGAMRLWAHHAVAHGADAVVYFRWRRCLEGQEQYHSGLRKRDGSPDRGYHDAAQVAEELFELENVDAPVALLHDYENVWALSEQPHAPDFDYWALAQSLYRALRARGIQVDVVHPTTELSGYSAVVAPTLHIVTEQLADHLTKYVASGGELLLGPRTGVKDKQNKLHPASPPGPLTALIGATVEQHETTPDRIEQTVVGVDGAERYSVRTWAERIETDAANPVLKYASGENDGHTAGVRNTVGDGHAVYCGVWPGRELADKLVKPLLTRGGIDHANRLPDGVRAAARDGHTWVMNFTSDRIEVESDSEWRVGSETVEPFDLSVAKRDLTDGLSVSKV